MTTLKDNLKVLDIMIEYISNSIDSDGHIRIDNECCIGGLCSLMDILVVTYIIEYVHTFNKRFIEDLYEYAPYTHALGHYWFPVYDFNVRLVFLKHVKRSIEMNKVIRFEYITT